MNGGRTNAALLNLIGIPMVFPLVSVVIVQKFIFRESLKGSLGICFKINPWYMLAVLIPIVMALLINAVNILIFHYAMFSTKTFISNILIGLSIAAASALLEEVAWRGFLYKEFKFLGMIKSSVIIGIIWAVWHIPVAIWYKYPGSPLEGAVINCIQMFILSIIISYIRYKAGSVFAAALMHGMLNTMILSNIMDDYKIVLIKSLLGLIIIAILFLGDFYRKKNKFYVKAG